MPSPSGPWEEQHINGMQKIFRPALLVVLISLFQALPHEKVVSSDTQCTVSKKNCLPKMREKSDQQE